MTVGLRGVGCVLQSRRRVQLFDLEEEEEGEGEGEGKEGTGEDGEEAVERGDGVSGIDSENISEGNITEDDAE